MNQDVSDAETMRNCLFEVQRAMLHKNRHSIDAPISKSFDDAFRDEIVEIKPNT